ncbi:hypothetical protein CDL15_Pgr018041 [Punica granatum]|uniref:Tf2-1-like SH3-like domain-containing protein n=1 Tax=Punica granatum TaxID=22663 RepID=A0A218WI22_PUNGR|nr:hypothetical protein CDL15_Pgr018041 [Punica granatum]
MGFCFGSEFAYNNEVRSSIGRSPFSVVYIKPPRHALDLLKLPKTHGVSVATRNMANQWHKVHGEVKKPEQANAKYKHAPDLHRRKQLFEVGDEVMLFLRKERFPLGTYGKLQPKKYGPYKILCKINDNAYVVDLPSSLGISKTFEVADIYPSYSSQEPLFADITQNSSSRSFRVGVNDVEQKVDDFMDRWDRRKVKTRL